MFRCEKCGKVTKPREPQTKIVTEKREKIYINDNGKQTKGWEIAKEIKVYEECAKENQ